MEASIDGFIMLNESLDILGMNPAAERLLGLSKEAARTSIGRSIKDLIPGFGKRGTHGKYQNVMRTGEPFITDVIVPHRRFGDIYLSVKAFKVGRGLGIIVSAITARKQMEADLRESEEKYRQLVENVQEGLWGIDRDACTTFVNPRMAEMLGYTVNEMQGEQLFSFMDERCKGTCKDYLERRKQGVREEHDFGFIRKDGTRVCASLEISPIEDDDGYYVGAIACVSDITERKRAGMELKKTHEELMRKEKLASLGQFAGNISHELRNTLATIGSSVYYLKTKLRDTDGKVQEHLERIKSSVDNATATIQSLLDLTRMKEPKLARLDLMDILSEAIDLGTVPGRVRVIRGFPEQGIGVNADPEQLRMAFKNIVANAMEAMEDKGTLTVTAHRAADGQAEVCFADTGPGIPPQNSERIFEPLFSTKAKGIGFGLSIAKMVIDRHGGTIEARSELGKGATITIRLPLDMGERKEE